MKSVVSSSDPVKSPSFDRLLVAEYMAELGMNKPAARFRDCGEGGRGWVGVCPGHHDVYHPFGCEQRVCPQCAGRRSRRLEERLVPVLLEQVAVGGRRRLGHVVLGTNVNLCDYMRMRGGRLDRSRLDDLRGVVSLLRGCVADLFRMFVQDGKVSGFAIGCEFGAKAGSLHFHVLFLGDYIEQRELSRLWASLNLGNGSYVYIEAINNNPTSVKKAVGYLCKYVTKPLFRGDREGGSVETHNIRRMAAWIDEKGLETVVASVAAVFYGLRRFQTYAGFYGLDWCDSEGETCPRCGAAYVWYSELDYLSSSLSGVNTFSTNKLLSDGGDLLPEQLKLWDYPARGQPRGG